MIKFRQEIALIWIVYSGLIDAFCGGGNGSNTFETDGLPWAIFAVKYLFAYLAIRHGDKVFENGFCASMSAFCAFGGSNGNIGGFDVFGWRWGDDIEDTWFFVLTDTAVARTPDREGDIVTGHLAGNQDPMSGIIFEFEVRGWIVDGGVGAGGFVVADAVGMVATFGDW